MSEQLDTPRTPVGRSRWRSRLGLCILGAILTAVGLTIGNGGLPSFELFSRVEGISEADARHLDKIKALGGKAHFMERTPRFLGLFGGRDLLAYDFQGPAFDDDALARLVKSYGDRVWGLSLVDTSVTDLGLRHLANLPHIGQLGLGSGDPNSLAAPSLNKFTDAGLVHLKGLTSLQNLQLGGLPITDAGLDLIKDLPDLGGLYLWRTRVQGQGLGRLKSLPKLAVLYLDGSPITEDAVGQLSGATNLQVLSLAGIPLTGHAPGSLKAVPKLKQLNIQSYGLGFEEISAFEAAHPAVKLE